MQRLMGWLFARRWLSDARKLEWYPPFWMMRIRVLELRDNWRTVRILLPLNSVSRNPGGVMFGGFQASLADPVAALACARIFPGHSVWTRGMSIDFDRGGGTDLELRFEISASQEADIRAELASRGRATPTFEYGYHLTDGTRCTRIRNTVAIRPRNYARATTPPASGDSVE